MHTVEKIVFETMETRHKAAVKALDERARTRYDGMLKEALAVVDYDEVDAILTDAHNRFSGREFYIAATRQMRGYIEDVMFERQAHDAEQNNEADTETGEPDWLRDGPEGTGSGSDPVAAPEAARSESAKEEVAPALTLEGQTNSQAATEFAEEQKRLAAEEKAKIAEDSSPKVKADQVDLFNTQAGIFDEPKTAIGKEARKLKDKLAATKKANSDAAEVDSGSREGSRYQPGGSAGNLPVVQSVGDGVNDNAGASESSNGAAALVGDAGKPNTSLGAENTIFTADRAAIEKADADFDDAMSDFGDIIGKPFRANLTPEQEQKIIPVLTRLMDAAFRKGYYKFKEAARFVLDALGAKFGTDITDQITLDHLQGAYIGMAGRYKDQGADSAKTVVSVEDKKELEIENVPNQRSGTDLEPDSGDTIPANSVGAEVVQTGRDGNGGTGGQGVQGTEGESGPVGSLGVSGHEALASGTGGDQSIYTGSTRVTPGSAGSSVSSGSGDFGLFGPPIEPDAAKATQDAATSGPQLADLKAAQAKASTSPSASIAESLPILNEGQQEDVAKAEERFAKPDGYGMLFTNGTGTGKTFLGLGIIKRFSNNSKNNILIVAPNDKIIEDWQRTGKLFGLNLARLENTTDAGKGIVITTYANMGANDSLAARKWDLVVHDEAHYLALDKDGTNTNALKTLRALTMHPSGDFTRGDMLHRDLITEINSAQSDAKRANASDDARDWPMAKVHQARADAAARKLEAARAIIKQEIADNQGEKRPRALMLSATPFAYEKSIDWANGYIFDYNEGRTKKEGSIRGYNEGSNKDQFFVQNFGYRIRYGKLTAPDAKVDSGIMQRQFNAMLKRSGALAGRMLDVKADYDRRFILVDSAIGQRIDEALQWFETKRKETGDSDKSRTEALYSLADTIAEKFDYLSRRYLLESIKAREVVPHIREHLAMGRKVVVFHDYKKGGGFNPFLISERPIKEQAATASVVDAEAWNQVVNEFNREFSDLIASDLFRQSSPIDMFKQEFPDVLLFNGDVPTKTRRANVAKFQDDASGPQVILVQSAAGKEGISLHDTTGKHQRVLFNLGQPTAPTTAIQQEGRIYRTGQVTDAIFRYLNTGTNWEKWAFATTIATRSSTAENLGMGEQARALKDAFITGFEESDDYRAGMNGEGKGGKERDKAANDALTEYDRAKAFYFGQQKKTSKTKAQEGADYFATPEPVGLKMVELADIRAGEDVLEPSAGHGAIARWMPDSAEKTAIEPSMTLRPRLAMVFDGKILDHNFEELNVVNKYDAIVMNPPFGSAGRTAIDHLAKAATHLRDGGRIVALIPTGPAADKKFEKWMYEEQTRPAKPIYTDPVHGAIYENDTLTLNAFGPPLKISGPLVIDGVGAGPHFVRQKGQPKNSAVNLVAISSITPGNRTETYSPAKGMYLVADINLPAVTFERAGTQVMARIVVLERQTDSAKAPAHSSSMDYTGIEDISELFDRMENITVPNRRKPVEDVAETSASKGKPVVDKVAAESAAQAAGLEIIEHTTAKGKVIRGVVRTDLTKAQAKEIDEFTFAKNGGFFIREKHLVGTGGAMFSRADIGKIGPWNKEAGFSPIPVKSMARVFRAFSHFRESGFPRELLAKIKTVTGVVYQNELFEASYNVATSRISLGKGMFDFDDVVFKRVLGHEVGHAADMVVDGGKVMSTLSAHPDMKLVIKEARTLFDSGFMDDVLWYPLDTNAFIDAPIEFVEQELFAQLVGLYAIQKEALKDNLPVGFNFIERALNEPGTIAKEAGQTREAWISVYSFERERADALYRFRPRHERRGHVQAESRTDGLAEAGRREGSGAQSGEVDPQLARTGVPDARILPSDLNAVASTFRKEFPGVPVVTVERESQLPDDLQTEIEDADAAGEVAGAFHNGAIYLVQDNLSDIEHAQDTIIHEAEHAGLSNLFGKSLDPVLLDVWKSNLRLQLDAKKIKDKYGYSQVRSIEEALAEMGSKAKALKGWSKVVAWVRAKLRKLGWVKEWTDQDVEALVLSALASLKHGGKTNLYRGSALSRDSSPTKQWAQRVFDRNEVKEPVHPIISKPGKVLNIAGIFRPIVMDFEHTRHIFNTHPEITPDEIGRLPFELQSPRVVFKDGRGWRVFINSRDPNGNPIAVALTNETLKEGKTVIKVTGISTMFGKDESASYLANELLAGNVSYIKREDAARVSGLINNARQPSEDLRSGPLLPIQASVNRLPTHPNSERTITVRSDDGDVKIHLPDNAPSLLSGTRFSRAGQSASLPAETKAEAAQRTVQDKFNRFVTANKWAAEHGVKLSENADVYAAEERYHGRVSVRIENFREKLVQPLIKKIQKAGFTMQQVADFLEAQHTAEANAHIQKITSDKNATAAGITDAEAAQYLAGVKPALATLANELRDITNQTRDLLLKSGIIDKDMADAWQKAYQYYVPLKGGDREAKTGTGPGMSVNGRQKRRLGHGKREEFVVENILRDHERAIVATEKNRVGQHLIKLALEVGALDPDLITIGKPEKRKVYVEGKTSYSVEKNGVAMGAFDSKSDAQRFVNAMGRNGMVIVPVHGDPRVQAMASPMTQENEAIVYVQGKSVRVQINDDILARAYKNMGVEQLNLVLQAGRGLNAWLSKAYTGYNPEFILVNMARDLTGGLINLTGNHGAGMAAKALANYPKAFREILRFSMRGIESPDVREYRMNGGSTGAAYLGDIERIGKDVDAAYNEYVGVIENAKNRHVWKAARAAGRKVVGGLLGWVEHLNAASENAMRLASYVAVRNETGSTNKAASAAKNVTVNFNRKGEIGATAGALYLFANPNIQGTAALWKALAHGEHKKQAWALVAGMTALAALAALQFDDDEWDKIPDYEKDRNLLIRVGDSRIKIPVPYGYGFFFALGNVYRNIKSGTSPMKTASHLASSFFEHFSPVGNPVQSPITMLPTAVKIAMEPALNVNDFGRKIVPESPFSDNKPDFMKMNRTTSGSLYDDSARGLGRLTGGTKATSGAIDVSPETLKYWTRTMTGGTGAFVADLMHFGYVAGWHKEAPDLHEMPIVRKFAGTGRVSDARSAYWEKVEEATRAWDEYKAARKEHDQDGMNKLAGNKELFKLAGAAQDQRESISMLRDRQTELLNDETKPLGYRRMAVKELEKKEEALYQRILEAGK